MNTYFYLRSRGISIRKATQLINLADKLGWIAFSFVIAICLITVSWIIVENKRLNIEIQQNKVNQINLEKILISILNQNGLSIDGKRYQVILLKDE